MQGRGIVKGNLMQTLCRVFFLQEGGIAQPFEKAKTMTWLHTAEQVEIVPCLASADFLRKVGICFQDSSFLRLSSVV